MKSINTCILLITLYGLLNSSGAFGNPFGVVVDSTTNYIEGLVAPFNTLRGGDTIFLLSGHHHDILIKNIHGDALQPIVIINHNGPVHIDTDHHYGISIENSSFFKFTGTGDEDEFYGIRIERVGNGGGLGISHNSSDYEIDHFYISNCPIGGIYAKTDPDCSFTNTREKFIQKNAIIHDNYITNVGNEGLYVGSTKYYGQVVNCNGVDTLLMPSLLKGVRIYNNILNITGWDGIQISSASEDCRVYDNVIMYDSQDEQSGQMSGIILGGGTSCDCFNNYITSGKGNGIESHGLGNSRIFNNVIENAGLTYKPGDYLSMKYGIYVTDVSTMPNNTYYLLFNDIINPKSDGIRFTSQVSKNNVISSNIIINPGNFDYYENGSFAVKGIDSYVMIPTPASTDVQLRNNYFARNSNLAGFSSIDYSLLPGSPLIDTGDSQNWEIDFDFYHRPRPYNSNFDIGAFEFNPDFLGIQDTKTHRTKTPVVIPNPGSGTFSIDYYPEKPGTVTLWILDLKGLPVHKQTFYNAVIGKQSLNVDIQDQPDGLYIYHLESDEKIFSGKILLKRL